METPDNVKYTKDHEWVRVDEKIATVGITDYAQEQLGDIVYVELPDEGEEVKKDETFGAVESVKSVSDCFSPVSGKIIDVNNLLDESPETINGDCFGDGWMIRIEMSDAGELDGLMDATAYSAFVKEESS